jgi:hypothetical protein
LRRDRLAGASTAIADAKPVAHTATSSGARARALVGAVEQPDQLLETFDFLNVHRHAFSAGEVDSIDLRLPVIQYYRYVDAPR